MNTIENMAKDDNGFKEGLLKRLKKEIRYFNYCLTVTVFVTLGLFALAFWFFDNPIEIIISFGLIIIASNKTTRSYMANRKILKAKFNEIA